MEGRLGPHRHPDRLRLAVLMIFKRYEPAVITAVVTVTSLAAAELVR